MATVLDQLPHGSRVAVVRLRSLGDCVLTTPALHLLKRHRPDLSLGVVVEERFAAVYDGNPDVDRLLPPSVAALLAWRPRLCTNLHGGTRSALLTGASLARWRAGFQHFRHAWLYNVPLPRAQEVLGTERTVHTAEHVASAVFHLGVPLQEIPRARLFVSPGALTSSRFVVLHPFASSPEKTWPAERFLAVADLLREEAGLQPVFVGGPGDDLSRFDRHATRPSATLAETKALLRQAALFVGNDSGPAHLAAAFGVPVVVLFGPSNPIVWAPWRTAAEVLTTTGPVSGIPLETVVQAVQRLGVAA